MQEPNNGMPPRAQSRSSSSRPSSRSVRMAAGKAPDPGQQQAVGGAQVGGVAVMLARAPTCSSAFSTERRLPIP